MSNPDMILIRLTTELAMRRGAFMTSRSSPSTRYLMRTPSRCTSTWMSEAPIRTASASILLTSLTIGAWSSTARRCASSSPASSSSSENEVCAVSSPMDHALAM